MRTYKTYPIPGHGFMTAPEIHAHRTNTNRVPLQIVHQRLFHGDRSLVRLLRPVRGRRSQRRQLDMFSDAGRKANQQPAAVLSTVDVPTPPEKEHSDGSTARYYELPEGATELQHLIGYKDMNAQIGEVFRACYRYGQVAHSSKLRDAQKMLFYIQSEIERLKRDRIA